MKNVFLMLGQGCGDGGKNINERTPREGQDPKGLNWGYLYRWVPLHQDVLIPGQFSAKKI